jgi:hypothetical protein
MGPVGGRGRWGGGGGRRGGGAEGLGEEEAVEEMAELKDVASWSGMVSSPPSSSGGSIWDESRFWRMARECSRKSRWSCSLPGASWKDARGTLYDGVIRGGMVGRRGRFSRGSRRHLARVKELEHVDSSWVELDSPSGFKYRPTRRSRVETGSSASQSSVDATGAPVRKMTFGGVAGIVL